MSELKVEIENGKSFSIDGFNENSATVDGKSMEWDISDLKNGKYHLIKDDKSYRIDVVGVDLETKEVELKVNNTLYSAKVEDRFDLLLQQLGMDNIGASAASDLKAPMPGMVLKIEVEAGQEVKKGEPLVVLEAMKMENVLKSPADLVVKSIAVEQGIAVEKNQLLVEFES